MALPTIASLWIGDSLSWMEQLCIQSFLDNGHEFILFTYDNVDNVPKGVKIVDASTIFPTDKIIRHARTGSPAYHADVFRLHMIRDTDYIWADTDAYCCQPWTVGESGHFHGFISDAKPMVNNGVLKLPKDSKTLAKMLEFTSDEYPIPPWFSAAERKRLQSLKDAGEGVHVSLLPWGVWGPNALTWFLKETGEIEHSFPGHVIYPIPFHAAGIPLNPNRPVQSKRYVKNDTLSIHFWGRRFRNVAAKYDGVPDPKCYISELVKKHKINPSETASMMQKKEVGKVEFEKITDVDFSMFDDVDVANMILQRPEIGDVDAAVNSWVDGNDAPLLEYAKENKQQILNDMLEIARRECNYFVKFSDEILPKRIADIGCGYAFVDLFLYNRYKSEIILIDIEKSENRHLGFENSGAGYADLKKAKKFLTKNAIPAKKITILNPNTGKVADINKVDLAISLASCGFHYPASTYKSFFENQISDNGGVVLDIKVGSRGVKYMKQFGAVNVLKKHGKHSMVFTKKER